MVRKIAPEAVFFCVANLSSLRQIFDSSRIVRILPLSAISVLPFFAASTVIYCTSLTRMLVEQMVSIRSARARSPVAAKRGKSMSRYQIWPKMKKLCARAGVDAGEVFPRNLRHLFATAFYRAYKDIVKLADVLGHSSIETTRIYLVTSMAEHRRQLEQLKLVS